MDKALYNSYTALLKKELVPAFGCTEPGAVAYAASLAAELLGETPEQIQMYCSASVIKNVHSVSLPGCEGMKGIEAAAALGAIGGRPERRLEILACVTPEHIRAAQAMLAEKRVTCELAQDVAELYILACAAARGHTAEVEIAGTHTNVTCKKKDGQVLYRGGQTADSTCAEMAIPLRVEDILEYANHCDLEQIGPVLELQIQDNLAIAQEGLKSEYGIGVGRFLAAQCAENDIVRKRACALAAAGSDARMSGCSLPVVINSGSGNQGMTVSLPVIEYARQSNATHERLLRALAAANLIALMQKRYIGSLSAFCGVVCAAAGAACGVAYLKGGGYEEFSSILTYTLGTIGGMVCDGAKASCAAKISAALDTALTGMERAMQHCRTFAPGDGLVKDNVEETVASVGRMGKTGMRGTNVEILNIMLDRS